MCLARAEKLIQLQLDEAGINSVVSDLLRDYDRTLTKAWKRESNKAIDDGIDAFLEASSNTTGYQAMLAVLAARLSKVTNAKDVKRLTVLTDGLYRIVKEAEASKINTAFKITNLDKGAIRSLSGEGPFWLGEFYDTHLSARIADVGFRVAVEGGFGREAAGRTLRDALTEHFALRGGTTFESTVPARFAGNVDNYTRIVSANVAQRSRVYSAVSAFSNGGIQRYQFSAVMDERTSEVCQEMNGRIFSVRNAVSVIREVSLAESPEEFMESHPWPASVEVVREIAGRGSLEEQSSNLESAGIAFPPLHGFCRSSIEAID